MQILAIDDNEINLALLEASIIDLDADFFAFTDPLKGVEFANRTKNIDVLLVDYMMPKMDGIEVIQRICTVHPDIVVMMITAISQDRNVKLQALEAGATDFLTKPLDILEFKNRLTNLYKLRQAQKTLKVFNANLQKEVSEAVQTVEQREFETLTVLSSLSEYKDPETGSHINRVAHYSKMLAEKAGLDEHEAQVLFYASPLHDMGKVGIPDNILLKPGKLTHEEFDIMKKHAMIGFQILQNSKNPYLKAGAIICLSHHEKYNGKGYPNGLSGKEIPLYGRITAIADVFDALTSVRPYKKAWLFDDAMALIKNDQGQHFDPELAALFIENRLVVEQIYHLFKESENKLATPI